MPKVGPHSTDFEPPDVIRLSLSGTVQPGEAEELNAWTIRYSTPLPHFFYLIDFSRLDAIPAEVRKEVAHVLRDRPLRGTAIYGASHPARVVAKLLLTAVNLVGKRAARLNPITFHESESEARTWIEFRRQALALSDDATT